MIMLDISPVLSTAYFLKELLYSILDEKDPDTQKKLFSDWIEEASESEISSFVKNVAARKILCKKESKQTKGLRSRHNEGFPLDNPFPERRLQYARLGVNTVVVFWEF